ncbi:MAG: hypothetical protein H7066_10475 [Cytophagaceae bacterium]|nr:hypothetical protein [Gemmatimonadaceae bacterium]
MRILRLVPAVGVGLLLSTGVARGQGTSDPLHALSLIVGVWDVDDTYRAASGTESREVGVRTCAPALLTRYIECVTRARNAAGREREYRWFLTFNAPARRYELLAMFSNTSLMLRQTIRIDSTGLVWNIRSPASVNDDGVEQWSGAQLRFEGTDRAVWTGFRNFDTMPITEWGPSTRETWVRRRNP